MASVDWILQFAVYSGWISDPSVGSAAANIAGSLAMISQSLESQLHPSSDPLIHFGVFVLRNYFTTVVDIPVRVYSIYYLGKSILENVKVCMKNTHRKQTIARNFFVHTVTAAHSLHSLALKCYRAFAPDTSIPKTEQPASGEAPQLTPAQKDNMKLLCKDAYLKYHPDKNPSDPDAAAKFIGIREVCEILLPKLPTDSIESDVKAFQNVSNASVVFV